MHGGDLTRSSFDASRHFSGVRMQQGRVQLDADWNEQLDIQGHRDHAAALDTIGAGGAPKRGGGFRVLVAPGGSDLLLDPGRIWVDGTLCELEAEATGATLAGAVATVDTVVLDGAALAVHDWVLLRDAGGNVDVKRLAAVNLDALTVTLDSAPAGLSGALRLVRVASYTTQPDLPAPALTEQPNPAAPRTLALDDDTTYLAYLDVFQRTVTALEAPEIREVALGGPDTTTRSRTVWQLRLLPLEGAPASLDCASDLSQWTGALEEPSGTMVARAEPDDDDVNLCTPTPAGGFTGLENQLYRVQVHDLDAQGRPLIVWSRHNGSVVTAWTGTSGNDLAVRGVGPDGELGFSGQQWVELLDDANELSGTPGTLVKLIKAEGDTLTVDPATADGSFDHDDFGAGDAKARRWDSDGAVAVTLGDWVSLERGVQVRFSPGSYRPGDFWLVPARTATADVEWPRDPRQPDPRPLQRPPHGVAHAWAPLALVRVAGGQVGSSDCRERFPSLTTLQASDVGFDDTVCAMPGVDTVQEALDQLCRSNDLRRHHRLLHGWGIVEGLQVHCGPDPDGADRRHVSVLPGSAIDAQGNDIDLGQRTPVDLIDLVDDLRQTVPDVLDPNGNGEVCMALRPTATGIEFPVSKFDPKADEPPELFNGTLLLDFYNDCLKSLHDWLRGELTPPPDEQGLPAGPAQQRIAALTNLIAQPVNRRSGRNVFVSPREDKLLQEFYTGLRERLQSDTFCAMFEGARTPPQYPTTIEGIDTIFGVGSHTRLRVRPGGGEAYSVGAGLSPFKPTGLINRYDLVQQRLVARIDPVAGKELGPKDKLDTGTGAATDVAFSPDGKRIYVAVPTRNEDNTIFRVGDIADDTIQWQPMVTICGVKLVTLATTAKDPDHVYAIGLRKVTTTENNKSVTRWHGAGLYKINPAQVDPNMSPLQIPEFFPVGHLVITPDGIAVATAVNGDVPVTAYTRLFQIQLPDGSTTNLPPVELGASGNDDLALTLLDGTISLAYVVVDSANGKAVTCREVGNGALVNDPPTVVQQGSGAVRLLGLGEVVAVTSADLYQLQLLSARDALLVPEYRLPLQVGPISIATDPKAKRVHVLNYVSNTLSAINRDLLRPEVRFDFAALEAYRKGMLEAYADLLGGFLQYLKDCLFDHFLVRRHEPTGAETLYLACVSIRDGEVYRVCNFSRRRYVKSFPTVGYWLSVIPLAPLFKRWFSQIACAVLPEWFSGLSVQDDSDAEDRVSVEQLQQLLAWAQSSDVLGRVREVRQRNSIAQSAARVAIRQAQPAPAPVGGPRILSSDIVGQPADSVEESLANRGVTIRREPFGPRVGIGAVRDVAGLFREAEPGDEITLFEENGTVRYFAINKRPAVRFPPPSPLPPVQPIATTEGAPEAGARPEAEGAEGAEASLAERVSALEQELATLRSQMPRRRQPRRTDPSG
jgi:Family of unknown function (DUF6519)